MQFNVDPYYDDFEQNALDNNYVRILFKPGQAVQARELTQIQSILQNQIRQFGDHVFQDGSPVIGGNLTLDNKVKYLKLEETFNNEDVDVDLFDGRVIRSTDGTVQAKVLTTYFPTDGTPTLLVKYITGNEFGDASNVRVAGTTTEAKMLSSNSTGSAIVCSINEGVFYVDGFFVKVGNQTTPVNPYGTSANVKIGLEIIDDVVDSVVDTTLLDPAQGSFNYQAPGADRYQFSLSLSTRPLDTVVDESKFFELMRVENGAITKQVKYPIYAELEKTLARRTFDESGDYVIRPFRATINDAPDSNSYMVSIEPGKAYVKGFEFETLGTFKYTVPKPRSSIDVKSLVDVDVDVSYGNYMHVTSIKGSSNGFINIGALEKVDIHCVKTGNVAIGLGTTANGQIYANTKIGTARIKNFVRYSADANTQIDSNGVYKLYLTEVNIQPKVVKVSVANTGNINLGNRFSALNNAYQNVSITILPIRLDAIANVNVANVFINSYRLNANSAVANVFNTPNVNVGSVIRVGDMVREVVSVNTSGDYLTVNTAWDTTIVATNKDSNPLSVFVQSDYTQNVTNQTRLITSYNGVTYNAELDRNFDDNGVPDSNTVVQLNYGIDDAESFISGPVVANTLATVPNVSMNVDSTLSKYINGDAYITDPKRNKLIFRLPGFFIKRASLNNVDYNYFKLIPNRSASPAGQFTLSQGSGFESFETIPWADSTSAIQDNLIVIVRDNNGNTQFPNGTIVQLTSANVSLSGSPTSTLTITTGVSDILSADIIVNVKENDAEDKLRTKVFMQNTAPTISPTFTYPASNTAANANVQVSLTNFGHVASIDVSNGYVWLTNSEFNTVRPGDSISLFVPDVARVRRVLVGNTTNFPDQYNYKDVTNNFFIDYGQRDDRYDHAKLILKSGYDSPSGKMLVHVDMFQHIYATGSNVSFFCADSYSQAVYDDGLIPIYTSSGGEVYYLRDCLDYRPTLPIGDTSGAYTVPNIPGPDETSELSHDYYLPRIDKLVLSKDKEFRVISGKSAPNPLPPNDLDDAMTLYQINIPAYGANIRDFKLKYFDNRRLTMKELANLSKRVEKLEYYTSFNNVENLALADKTQYEDGTEKEKYGIVGENFRNFNIADYKNEDFGVALENGFMVPAIRHQVYGLKNIANSSTTQNKKTISLQYTETPAIVQNVASNKAVSVQPFLFGQFNGMVELAPETDFWFAETLKPEIISVPERIIEHTTVIREIIKEPPAPVTIVNNYYSTNAVGQIIISPGDDTSNPGAGDIQNPNPASNTVVVIPSTGTGTVVVSDPPKDPPDPPSANVVNGGLSDIERRRKDIEDDLWWGPDFALKPLEFGVSFTYGVSGTNIWYPKQSEPIYIPQTSVQPESVNPTVTEPIILSGTSSVNYTNYETGGTGTEFGEIEFNSFDFNLD